jgi:hypothetical protein
MRSLTLKTEPFGNGKFKIELPSRRDATMELFDVAQESTDLDILMEDDGYFVVETGSQNEANIVKEAIENYLNSKEANSGYGDVKGLQPAEKDIKRIEDLRDKANGDEDKMHKLAQNMANTFKTSTSYEKCIRRARAAEVLELGGIAKIFYKKAEEIKPEKAAASHDEVSFHLKSPLYGGEQNTFINKMKKAIKDIDVKFINSSLIKVYNCTQELMEEIVKKFRADIDLDVSTASMRPNLKPLADKIWDEYMDCYDVDYDDDQMVFCGVPLYKILEDNEEFNSLSDEDQLAIEAELDKRQNSFASLANDGKRVGKLSYRKEGLGDSASWFMIEGRGWFQLRDQESAKELKKLGDTFKFHINEDDEAIDLEPVSVTAADYLENKYSNEEEEFTIDEFEKDAGPVPELKKFKNAFYSIVHYNKETDQFEIMIYPKELDYEKNNPKVVVLDSSLTTVVTSAIDDSESRNLRWGFYGSLTMSPFSLSDADAHDCFMFTVQYISDRTGYMENVIRDFLDSQAGRFLADMVTYKPLESGDLQSVFEAVKSTIGEGALNKLKFESFVSSHDPADFDDNITEASVSSNFDIFIDELEKAQSRDPGVNVKFRLHWHKLEKLADFFAEIYNGGLNQFLDHHGDNIPRSVLVDVGGKACNEIVDIIRDGSNAIQDYLDYMESEHTTDEDYHDIISPMNALTDKIYENDKIEQACGEILEFYGVKK